MKKGSVLVVLALMCNLAFADRIYFKNGDVLTGTIVQSDQKKTTIETSNGSVEVSTSDIARIEYSDPNNPATTNVAADPETQQSDFFRKHKAAIIWRPLPTLVAAIGGYFDLVMEGQTAFSKSWAITSIDEFGFIGGVSVISIQLGPQYRPFGQYLNGFFVGAYPGIGWMTDYIDWLWFFTGTLEVGYEWVSTSRLVIGVSTGLTAFGGIPTMQPLKFNLSAHIGWVTPDPLMKAK